MTAFTCGLGVFTSSLCFLKIIMKWDNLAFYLGINYWNANINGSSKWGKNMADNRIRFVILITSVIKLYHVLGGGM